MMNKNVNVKESFVQLVKNNKIWDGRIITNPFELSNNKIDVSMSFTEIEQFQDEFTFYDDVETTRGDDSGILKIDFNNVEKVIYFVSESYKNFNAMLYFKDNLQVQIAFNLKNEQDIPLQWGSAVSKGSLCNPVNKIMTNELIQALNKVVELSKTSTLCGHYTNGVITVSFKIDEDLTITEQATGDSFSIWCHDERMSTPTAINLKYADIKSFEFITEEEMSERSNGECSLASLEIKLVDSSEIIIFEDVA